MKKRFLTLLSVALLSATPLVGHAALNAANTVNSAAIIDGSVATADIANLAVTSAKIANNAVSTTQIANYAVTSTKLANNAVTTVQIANGSVTAAKLGIICNAGQTLSYSGATWTCSNSISGPAGPEGPQGATGPEGPQGPAGSSARYSNVIVVAQSGGDFTDLSSALESISDASPSNRYLIKIMPGVYIQRPLNTNNVWSGQTMGSISYVDVEGSGESNTILVGGEGLFYGAFWFNEVTNSEVRGLTVRNDYSESWMSSFYPAGIWFDSANDITLTNVTIEATGAFATEVPALSAYSGSNIKLKNVTTKTPNIAISAGGSNTVTIFDSLMNGVINTSGPVKIINSLVKTLNTNGQAKTINSFDANYDAITNGIH